jgi:hypothetical protein
MSKLRDDAKLVREVQAIMGDNRRARLAAERILDAVDAHLAARTPGAPAPRPGRYPCKPWCGTKEVPAREAFYTRKGLYYCRDRCAREASRFERLGDRPSVGAPLTPAGEPGRGRTCCKPWCGEHWNDIRGMKPIPSHWSGREALYSFCYCSSECSDNGGPLNPLEPAAEPAVLREPR